MRFAVVSRRELVAAALHRPAGEVERVVVSTEKSQLHDCIVCNQWRFTRNEGWLLANIFEACDVVAERAEADRGAAGIDVGLVFNRERLPLAGCDTLALCSVALRLALCGIVCGCRNAVIQIGVMIGPCLAGGIELFELC